MDSIKVAPYEGATYTMHGCVHVLFIWGYKSVKISGETYKIVKMEIKFLFYCGVQAASASNLRIYWPKIIRKWESKITITLIGLADFNLHLYRTLFNIGSRFLYNYGRVVVLYDKLM